MFVFANRTERKSRRHTELANAILKFTTNPSSLIFNSHFKKDSYIGNYSMYANSKHPLYSSTHVI